MIILAMDTAGPSVSVALLRDHVLVYECTLQNGRTHSVSLMRMVDEAAEQARVTPAEIDLFAAVTGPGSFTGVRIGVSTVKALAQAAGKPCIGINALEAYAVGTPGTPICCPIFDARAGQVYGAAFQAGLPPVRLLPDCVLQLPAYLALLAPLGSAFCFTGDGVAVHEQAIAQALGGRALFAPPSMRYQRAAQVAMLAAQYAENAVSYEKLLPLYLRAPQAERERAAREAEKI